MKSRPSVSAVASWTLILAQVGLAAAIRRFGPSHPIATHFDLSGRPDRWGDRSDVAAIVLAAAAICAVVVVIIQAAARRSAGGLRREFGLLRLVAASLASTIGLLAAAATWGWSQEPGPVFAMIALCAVFVLLGAWLGKTAPNPLVGVRTPWTFASRLAWDKANRLAGRILFWGGLVGLAAAPWAPQPAAFQLTLVAVLIGAAACVIESWRVYRRDPERRPLRP